MPQIKVEKKFFRIRVARNRRNPETTIHQKFTIASFQEIQKNITGGEE